MIHPPAAEKLMERGRRLRILSRIQNALDAWSRGLEVNALELLNEARAMIEAELEREDNGDSGVPQGETEGRRRE